MIRRTRVEIDLAAIVSNARAVRELAATALYAVVKADGYGHGAIEVARALERARAADGFCVSLVEEGVALREAGITAPVLVMGPSQLGGEDEVVANRLTPVVSSRGEVAELAQVAAPPRRDDRGSPQGRHRDGQARRPRSVTRPSSSPPPPTTASRSSA